MATFAPNTDLIIAELAERERRAWSLYKDRLADLGGDAYDEAEPGAWSTLQTQLQSIEADRAEVEGSSDSA